MLLGHLVLLVPIQASAGEGIRIDYDSGWADRLFGFMASRNSAEYTVAARAGQQLQWQVNGGPGKLQSTPSPEQFPLLIEKKAGDGTQGFGLQHVLVYPRPSLLVAIVAYPCPLGWVTGPDLRNLMSSARRHGHSSVWQAMLLGPVGS